MLYRRRAQTTYTFHNSKGKDNYYQNRKFSSRLKIEDRKTYLSSNQMHSIEHKLRPIVSDIFVQTTQLKKIRNEYQNSLVAKVTKELKSKVTSKPEDHLRSHD